MSNPETAPLPEDVNNPKEPTRHLQDADTLAEKPEKDEGQAWPESFDRSATWAILHRHIETIIRENGADPDKFAQDVAWALDSDSTSELDSKDVVGAIRYATKRQKV